MSLPDVVSTAPTVLAHRAELVKALRACTPKQRAVLRKMPEHHGQIYGAANKLGISRAKVMKWHTDARFMRAREMLERLAIEEIGVSTLYVLSRTKEVVERSMQSAPVTDKDGNPVLVQTPAGDIAPAYAFDPKSALGGLTLIGKYRRTWGEDAPPAAVPEGPGLTVIVQTGGSTVGVQVKPASSPGLSVDLPEPE